MISGESDLSSGLNFEYYFPRIQLVASCRSYLKLGDPDEHFY